MTQYLLTPPGEGELMSFYAVVQLYHRGFNQVQTH